MSKLNRKGTMTLSGVSITNAQVVSVEKGNVGKGPIGVVCAFSVRPEGYNKNVKALLKGELAVVVYQNFLEQGKSTDSLLEDPNLDYAIKRTVLVSFKGNIREDRPTELVVQDLTDVKFNYSYEVVAG